MLFAQIFREGRGTNRTTYTDFYIGDAIAKNRMTIDLGLRYDQQGGKARRNSLLGDRHHPHATEEEQKAVQRTAGRLLDGNVKRSPPSPDRNGACQHRASNDD